VSRVTLRALTAREERTSTQENSNFRSIGSLKVNDRIFGFRTPEPESKINVSPRACLIRTRGLRKWRLKALHYDVLCFMEVGIQLHAPAALLHWERAKSDLCIGGREGSEAR
jgi:hypothetical protein